MFPLFPSHERPVFLVPKLELENERGVWSLITSGWELGKEM